MQLFIFRASARNGPPSGLEIDLVPAHSPDLADSLPREHRDSEDVAYHTLTIKGPPQGAELGRREYVRRE